MGGKEELKERDGYPYILGLYSNDHIFPSFQLLEAYIDARGLRHIGIGTDAIVVTTRRVVGQVSAAQWGATWTYLLTYLLHHLAHPSSVPWCHPSLKILEHGYGCVTQLTQLSHPALVCSPQHTYRPSPLGTLVTCRVLIFLFRNCPQFNFREVVTP